MARAAIIVQVLSNGDLIVRLTAALIMLFAGAYAAKARQNIDRAEGLQDEILAIARETRDLQADNNALLRPMLDTLEK